MILYIDACFIVAILMFALLDFFTIRAIYGKDGREVLGTVTVVGTALQLLSYLMVAISNPGIVTPPDSNN